MLANLKEKDRKFSKPSHHIISLKIFPRRRSLCKKLWLKHLFNYDARERIRVTNKLPYTQSKYLPKELDQPVSTSICGNTIAVTVYERKAILTYVIESEPIAKAYKKYFKFLWTLGKK